MYEIVIRYNDRNQRPDRFAMRAGEARRMFEVLSVTLDGEKVAEVELINSKGVVINAAKP